ncbi:MAG TPA: cytochrome c oxidase accessory protein CcoG [Opitutaceae bacterium]|nr:cytochrome c oxidase accessory protein CcoG [Opitutaceae bacterium]
MSVDVKSESPAKARRNGFVAPNRDDVTTIRADGSRRKIYPADVRGKFTTMRRWSARALIAIYLLLPWIKVRGYPAVFLDVSTRRFHLFGFTLAAQDLWLMFFLISGLGFSLFLLTSLFGRVWCGWACPQTVFLEHVFRRIERWIEGDAHQRKRLDAAPWGVEKILRKSATQILFVATAAGVAHLFLAYFVSIPDLWAMMRDNPGEHWGSFLFVFAATGGLYFNFAWFREQMCIVICPYGRMQSALIDEHSMVIGYDAKRGEPRGKLGIPDAGACIDCNRCVQVCPTGIDIRQGLQMECIGCTACVDACDQVMTKIQRPTGLIRYDSIAKFSGASTRWIRPRTIVYAVLFLVGSFIAAWAFSTFEPIDASVSRMRGAPYFVEVDAVRNQFLLRIVNKDDAVHRFDVKVSNQPEGVVVTGLEKPVEVGPLGEEVRPVIVQVSRAAYRGGFDMILNVADERHTYEVRVEAKFVGPDPELLKEDAAR